MVRKCFALLAALGSFVTLVSCRAEDFGPMPATKATEACEDSFPTEPTSIVPIQTKPLETTGDYTRIRIYGQGYLSDLLMELNTVANVLPYEAFSALGEFDDLRFVSDALGGCYEEYCYSFSNIGNDPLFIEVKSGIRDETSVLSQLPQPTDPVNLRWHQDKASGFFCLGDIRYDYNEEGYLRCISWVQGDRLFSIKAYFESYATGAYIVRQLLNAEKAPEAMAALQASVAKYIPQERRFYRTEESYLQATEEAAKDPSFVTARQLAPIGEFVSFSWLSDEENGDRSAYQYELRDESGYVLILKIDRYEIAMQEPALSADMLMGDGDRTMLDWTEYWIDGLDGVLTLDGIDYYYTDARLRCLSWSGTKGRITITAPQLSFFVLPGEADTFMEKILTGHGAAEALAQLK